MRRGVRHEERYEEEQEVKRTGVPRLANRSMLTRSQIRKSLNRLEELEDGWDSYGAAAPSETAIVGARKLVKLMIQEHCFPSRIAPSAIGGVGVSARNGVSRVYIEMDNDGVTHAMFSDYRPEPEVCRVDLEDGAAFIARVQEHLGATT